MADAPVFTTLLVEATGTVGRLTLNRPEKLNAMSRVLLSELIEAARWLDSVRDLKIVIVTGAGRAFSAGFDLHDFQDPDPEVPVTEVADRGRRMAEAVTGMNALTIGAIRGRCVGGGLVLAAACDLRVASDTAVFSIPEVDLGIPLAWGGIPRLVRELGPAITKELVLTCREFDAHEAKALRFLNRVVPDDDLERAVEELAEELAWKSSLTLGITKRAVNAVAEDMASTAHGRVDAHLLAAALGDEESRAAGRAYLTRRAGS
jgi:enoyl-CoA hydratase/carnithine racemase